MNRKIIKNFKLNIYNTDSPNNSQKYTMDILYYIIFIYLITFIMKKLSKKRIEKNMKYKEKDENKRKRIERDKTDP